MRYLFLLLLLVGCGARKVNKSTTETTTKVDITVVDSTKIDTKEDSEATICTDEFEITPIDTIKPLVIINERGKILTIKNGSLKKRTQISRFKAKKEIIEYNTHKSKNNTTRQAKSSQKQIERKAIPTFWWIVLIILLFLYAIRRYLISRFI